MVIPGVDLRKSFEILVELQGGGDGGNTYGAAEGDFSLIDSGDGDGFRADACGPSSSTANRAATNRSASGRSYAAARRLVSSERAQCPRGLSSRAHATLRRDNRNGEVRQCASAWGGRECRQLSHGKKVFHVH